jgi:tetratricopeptide (TPR) repeat protein
VSAAAERVDELLEKGLAAYRDGKTKEAASAWEEALKLDPANPRAIEYLRTVLRPARMSATSSATSASAPSPWDDGPSLARPLELKPPDTPPRGMEMFAPQPAAAQRPKTTPSEVDAWLAGARELAELDDFSGTLELVEKILSKDPAHPEALKLKQECEHELTKMYESVIGSMLAAPVIAIPQDEIIWLNLDHRAGFVLAQIDGQVSYEDLFAICGMSRLDTARILAQLVQEGVVKAGR